MAYVVQAPTVAQQIANYPGSQSSFNTYPSKEEKEKEESPYLPKYPQNFREYLTNATRGPLENVPQTRSATTSGTQQQSQQTQQKQTSQQQQQQPSAAQGVTQLAALGAGAYGASQLLPGAAAAPSVAAPTIIGATRLPGTTLTLDTSIAAPKLIGAEFVSPYSTWAGSGEALVGSETAGQVAGIAIPVIGSIVAIHQGKQTIENMESGDMTGAGIHGFAAGAGAGAAVGSIAGPAGAAIGAAIGAFVGAIGGMVGASHTGKDKDQLRRDGIRDAMQDINLIDEKYNLTLADGSKYDIGKDGHAKNFDGSGYAYQVARENPFSTQAVAWADALTYSMMGQDKKLATDFTGYFANAAMSNAKDIETVRANMLTFVNQAGLTRQQMEEALKRRLDAGQIDKNTFDALVNSIATLFDGKNYVTMSWSQAEQQMGNGQVTDQNPAAVPAPHPNAPESQDGFVINGLNPDELPQDIVLRMNNLYNYYSTRRGTQQAQAQTNPIAKEIVNYSPQTPLADITGTVGTMSPIQRGPNLNLLMPGRGQSQATATSSNPNVPEGTQGW